MEHFEDDDDNNNDSDDVEDVSVHGSWVTRRYPRRQAILRASMREVSRSLAKEHGDQLTKKGQNERLLAALDLLKKLGGAVALHETDGKKFIRGKSCPLAAITAHYPDACLIVEALLTEMIGVPVKEHCTHGQPSAYCFEVVKPTVVAVTPCGGRDRR